MDALRRAPLPPDAVQLPTSFELLGGGGGPGGVVSPRLSPRLAEGGLAAGGNGGGGGGMVEAGALPVQPGELQRSPSLDDLLSKVQRIDASQVRAGNAAGQGGADLTTWCALRSRLYGSGWRCARAFGPALVPPAAWLAQALSHDLPRGMSAPRSQCDRLAPTSAQVNVLAKIGEGAFGEVSLAHCSTYGNVAVKWIKPTKASGCGLRASLHQQQCARELLAWLFTPAVVSPAAAAACSTRGWAAAPGRSSRLTCRTAPTHGWCKCHRAASWLTLHRCPLALTASLPHLPPAPQVERHWASFWHEAELMSRLNHPNVLRFFGLVVEGPMVVGIMTGACKFWASQPCPRATGPASRGCAPLGQPAVAARLHLHAPKQVARALTKQQQHRVQPCFPLHSTKSSPVPPTSCRVCGRRLAGPVPALGCGLHPA